MKKNVGMIDKVLRMVVGLVLIALTLSGTIGPWGWIGIIPLVTGLMGWCLIYQLIGTDTCASDKRG